MFLKMAKVQVKALGFFENIQQYKPELDSLLTNNFRFVKRGTLARG